jgi:hypothetical protein
MTRSAKDGPQSLQGLLLRHRATAFSGSWLGADSLETVLEPGTATDDTEGYESSCRLLRHWAKGGTSASPATTTDVTFSGVSAISVKRMRSGRPDV